MLKEEFEKLIGKEVDYDVLYEKYNTMYMSIDCSKQDFVKMINIDYIPESEESIIAKSKIKEIVNKLEEELETFKQWKIEYKYWLDCVSENDKEVKKYRHLINWCNNNIKELKFKIKMYK